ncbi:hypothetical protein HMI55_006468 [Coelomomyces lativittatus]|nr:hypothetical protein HMI55_006468 [Coelomomyces lativittatus]KAJ1512403.1 hypothetical protein HMI56_004110 [Coelomomyces lativittatus]
MLRASLDLPNLPISFEDSDDAGYENEEHEIHLIMKEIEEFSLHPNEPSTYQPFKEMTLPNIESPPLLSHSPSDSCSSETTLTSEDLDAEFHKQLQLAELMVHCALHLLQSKPEEENLPLTTEAETKVFCDDKSVI